MSDTRGTGVDDPLSSPQAVLTLRRALAQIRAHGLVSVNLTVDTSGSRAAVREAWSESRLMTLLTRVFSRVPAQVQLHGTMDLAQGRAQLASRYTSVLQRGAQMWSGRPGRLLTTLDPEPVSARISPIEVLNWLAASNHVTAHVGGLVVRTENGTLVEVQLDGAGRIHTIRYPVERDTITVTIHDVATGEDLTQWDRLPQLLGQSAS